MLVAACAGAIALLAYRKRHTASAKTNAFIALKKLREKQVAGLLASTSELHSLDFERASSLFQLSKRGAAVVWPNLYLLYFGQFGRPFLLWVCPNRVHFGCEPSAGRVIQNITAVLSSVVGVLTDI